MRVHTLLLLVCGLAFAQASLAGARKWTDDSGRYTVEAELVEVKGDQVWLKKADSEPFPVPLARLSDADRRFLASLQQQKLKAEAEKPDLPPQVAKFLHAVELYRPKEIKTLEARIERIKKTLATPARRPEAMPQDGPPTVRGQPMHPVIRKLYRRGAAAAEKEWQRQAQKKDARLRQALSEELREAQRQLAALKAGKVVVPWLHPPRLSEGQIGRFEPRLVFEVQAIEGPDSMLVSWGSNSIFNIPDEGLVEGFSASNERLRVRGIPTGNLQAKQMPGGPNNPNTPINGALRNVVFEVFPREPSPGGGLWVLRPFDLRQVGPLLEAPGRSKPKARKNRR
jgi:hypothetical protein